MNLRALRTLVEIDRVGGFATAADRLGLTLSAVSAQMKALEIELGFGLFDRTRRPPALTPEGRQTAAHARAVFAEIDAVRAIGEGDGGVRGRYRIGFVGTAGVRLMPGFLAGAAAAHPEARISVESGLSDALIDRVRSGDLDAAVVTETPDPPREVALHRLRREPFALAAPAAAAEWPLGRCVRELPFIQFRPSSGIGLLVERYLRRAHGDVAPAIVLDNVESVMGCVNSGLGYAIVPEPDARRYAGEAAISALSDPPLSRHLALAVRSDAARAQAAAAFAALLREPA